MNIGFDAKRAYQNSTGLGHYSRTLISSLAEFYPDNKYFLFTPEITDSYNTTGFSNIQTIFPNQLPSSFFKSVWRSKWVNKDLLKNKIDVYHGLSHEIPVGINKTDIKSVVTIHDLIFERYPDQYKPVDRMIYRKKFLHACTHADKVIAISKQTKQDIIDFYKVPEEKIVVCYQSCNPSFSQIISSPQKEAIRSLYKLPDKFFLYVGSIIERKNLLTICKALAEIQNPIPLVVIGDGSGYKQTVENYIRENSIDNKVIFLSADKTISSLESFRSSADFPAIYQMATALIYPSIFEGFGIPVLEALNSRLPVITSNTSCLPETGGDAAILVNPESSSELKQAMVAVASNNTLKSEMADKGIKHAKNFSPQICAEAVMKVYQSL